MKTKLQLPEGLVFVQGKGLVGGTKDDRCPKCGVRWFYPYFNCYQCRNRACGFTLGPLCVDCGEQCPSRSSTRCGPCAEKRRKDIARQWKEDNARHIYYARIKLKIEQQEQAREKAIRDLKETWEDLFSF